MSRFFRLFAWFLSQNRGSASVEFAVLIVPLVSLILFIVQISIAYHWALSAQKAVENGARTAATLSPVATDLIEDSDYGERIIIRDIANGGSYGGPCYSGNCTAVAEYSCTGGIQLTNACDSDRFDDVMDAINAMTYNVEPEEVTITYTDMDLGYAGTSYVPVITVEIAQRAYPDALSLFGLETNLPAVTSTTVSEGLGQQ